MGVADRNSSDHFRHLRESYVAVGQQTWLHEDFLATHLDSSRRLYTDESLQERNPAPRDLEVFGLLSGLPFSQEFRDALAHKQEEISAILDGRLHYWVKADNLGLEYFVFKWPDQPFAA